MDFILYISLYIITVTLHVRLEPLHSYSQYISPIVTIYTNYQLVYNASSNLLVESIENLFQVTLLNYDHQFSNVRETKYTYNSNKANRYSVQKAIRKILSFSRWHIVCTNTIPVSSFDICGFFFPSNFVLASDRSTHLARMWI